MIVGIFERCTLFQSASVKGLACLVSWDLQHVSPSIDVVFLAHSLVLALVLYTSERFTGFQCTSVTRSVASHEAVIEDLGCAGYSSLTDCLGQHTQHVSLHQALSVTRPICIKK